MQELLNLRTANSKTYLLDNGSKETVYSARQIHYQDANGDWQELSVNITSSTLAGYDYSNTANSFKFHFKSNLNQANSILFTKDDTSIGFRPRGVAYYDASSNAHQILATASDTTCTVTVTATYGEILFFNNLYPKCDYIYKSGITGIKEYIRLEDIDNLPDPAQFGMNPDTTYLVFVNQITLTNIDTYEDEEGTVVTNRDLGIIKFKNAGISKFEIPILKGWIERTTAYYKRIYELKKRFKVISGVPCILHGIKYSELITAKAFPLILDTTVNVSLNTDFADDNSAYYRTWDSSYNFTNGDFSILTGLTYEQQKNGGTGYLDWFAIWHKAYLRFPLTISKAATINNATLSLRAATGYTNTKLFINGHNSANSTLATGLDVYNASTISASIYFNSRTTLNNVYDFNVKNIIASITTLSAWASGNYAGILISPVANGTLNENFLFYAADDPNNSGPTLTVSYEDAGGGGTTRNFRATVSATLNNSDVQSDINRYINATISTTLSSSEYELYIPIEANSYTLSATINTTLDLSDINANIYRDIFATINSTLANSDSELSINRYIESVITSTLSLSDSALDVLRDLLYVSNVTLSSEDVIVNVNRYINATFSNTISTSDIDANIVRELTSNISNDTSINDIVLTLFKSLVATSNNSLDTEDITVLIAEFINFVSNISTSLSTSDISLLLEKLLNAVITNSLDSSDISTIINRYITSSIASELTLNDIIVIVNRYITSNVSTTISTEDAQLIVNRVISGLASSTLSVSDINVVFNRYIDSSIPSTLTTSDSYLISNVYLTSAITNELTISDVDAYIYRLLTAAANSTLSVSDILSNIVRDIVSSITTSLDLSDADSIINRNISTAINSTISISDISTDIYRSLATNVNSTLSTSDIEILLFKSLVSSIASSLDTSEIDFIFLRLLSVLSANELTSIDINLLVQGFIDFFANVNSTLSTSDIDFAFNRILTAAVSTSIDSSDISTIVNRFIDSTINSTISTSDIVTSINRFIDSAINSTISVSDISTIINRYVSSSIPVVIDTSDISTIVNRYIATSITNDSNIADINTDIIRELTNNSINSLNVKDDTVLNVFAQISATINVSLDSGEIVVSTTMISEITGQYPPDFIISTTNLTGELSYIQDDPDSPGSLWLEATDKQLATEVLCSFPTPPGPLYGEQNFKTYVRKTNLDGSEGFPKVRVDLYENETFIRSSAETEITSTIGELITFTWDASEVINSADVRIKIIGIPG